MSNDEYVPPVNHSAGSAFGAKAAGTAGGAVKGGLGAAALWIGALALTGIAFGVLVATPGGIAGLLGAAGTAGGAAGSGIIGLITNPVVVWGTIFGAIGTAVGIGSSWLPGGLGAIAGGLKGHAKASGRVEQERSAAMQQQAEISMVRAQMAEPTQQVNVGFPVQGSRFNQAESSISADSISNDGRMGGFQLQRA